MQMGIVGEKLEVDFMISTGDNFYDNGLTGVHDPAFKHSFTDVYTAPSLQKRWYTGMFLFFSLPLNYGILCVLTKKK